MFVCAKPGSIVTIAGNGEPAYAGDRGPAVSASLNEPKSIALDGHGHLFIADAENHVVRMVDLVTGLISTVAGCPEQAGSVYETPRSMTGSLVREDEDPLEDMGETAPRKYTQMADLSGTVRFVVGPAPGTGRFHGDGGPALLATLNFPTAVAIDEAGNLYIADTMNHRIRKVDAGTGVITTIAGTGQHRYSGDGGPATAASLNEPSALVVDKSGNLYVADQSNNRVRKIDLATGRITTVAGTGEPAYTGDEIPASEAGLAGPSGLALDLDGALLIADTFNSRIRRVDPDTGVIRTVAGDGNEYRYLGPTTDHSISLSRPYGIAVDPEGGVLITDSDSHLLRRWDRHSRLISRVAGNGRAGYAGDGGMATDSSLNYPFGVAADQKGNIYIADTFNHRIRLIVR